ncbi:MAG: PfaD family polyunsaturated fatty acid/polyketide biosynthesis protein [Alphaproteobacteria bacterium]|nr:PfaD family polyunsaturated fatty acid/polyketide biosynthesis protein [Alphaproteobacteria bacterium]MCB9695510.1 PfaD family polyunsaturated fatty acid/polyketide biosynthesis protein [Alphaproteobacteria bacterium]
MSAPTHDLAGRGAVLAALERLDRPFLVVREGVGVRVVDGEVAPGREILARVPALPPERLGDRSFREDHGLVLAYCAGAMANGIASVEVVTELARVGGLGFFGAAGLDTPRIRAAVQRLRSELGELPWGVNLIHSPAEPHQEQQTVDLLVEAGVRAIETSAFLSLTPMVVELRARGLRTRPDGVIVPARRLLAKVSRPEVAEKFLRPPPDEILRRLVAGGRITEDEARLAARLPMADDLTAEADSGGHTDHRPLSVLFPLLRALRDRIGAETGHRVRVGGAGGLGTPDAVAAAFAMGAAYVLTGSVNQACVESGTSDLARGLLADAGMADVTTAPASDMFEGGVTVQVLRRGTMFAQRGSWLYELYRDHASLESLPADVVKRLETQVLRASIEEVWRGCEAFFAERDPRQLEKAARDPKHRMALVFRWYLGLSSRWAIAGEADRRTDLQIWCGPAMGAFNDWTRGTFLERADERRVGVVAVNLMAGAALWARARWLTEQGVDPGLQGYGWRPRRLAPLMEDGDAAA